MLKQDYLETALVPEFVDYLASILSGKSPIDFEYRFHSAHAPSGYRDGFGLAGTAQTLEDLFDRYYWKREYHAANADKLLGFQRQLRSAMGGDLAEVHHAVAQIMDWGLNPSAAQANKAWATQQGDRLLALLEAGKRALESAEPDYSIFQQVRMNAGFTKVFSLLCDGIIIYDGRVGAALCWLVRRFLKHIGYAGPVPKALAFLWAPGRSAQYRNPSGDGFEFDCLTSDAPAWARANVEASWLLERARVASGSPWCAGASGLRNIECALFMLGYCLPVGEATRRRGRTGAPRWSVQDAVLPHNHIRFEYAPGSFDVDELEQWVRVLGRGYVIIGGLNRNFVEHDRPESLDYWLRVRCTRRNVRQATTALVERLVATGRFRLEVKHWPGENRQRKGLVLTNP